MHLSRLAGAPFRHRSLQQRFLTRQHFFRRPAGWVILTVRRREFNLPMANKQKDDLRKRREQDHLKCFLLSRGSSLDEIIEPSERPDFILRRSDGSVVGIELTGHLRDNGKRLRGQESEEDKAVDHARRIHESRELPLVDVAVLWLGHYCLTSKRRKELAPKIPDLVASSMPDEGQYAILENTGLPDPPVPKEVRSIRIGRFHGITENHWAVLRAGYICQISPEEVVNVLRKKEKELPAYRCNCDQVWLVIVIEGLRVSSLVELGETVGWHEYETDFDRAFLLQFFEGRAIELRTKKPVPDKTINA